MILVVGTVRPMGWWAGFVEGGVYMLCAYVRVLWSTRDM